MAHLGSTSTFWKLAQAAAISALLLGSAFAQQTIQPTNTISPEAFPSAPVMKEDPRAKQARENAYRAALKKIPDKKNTQPVDPWGNMRSAAPDSSKTKQGQQ